jgi:L-arabinokinase
MTAIVCYVSGHGYGHATRLMEVLGALLQRRPGLGVALRSSLDAGFFAQVLGERAQFGAVRLDVGVVQADSLRVDPHATLRAYAAICEARDDLIARELTAVSGLAPSLVLADIPALAFAVARRLGVPGVALGNFSWDWIYADYAVDFPELAWVVDELRRDYHGADLLLRLPMAGDMSVFPVVRPLPLVARRARLSAPEVRARLGLPATDRLALLSFGGLGLTLDSLPRPPAGVSFVVSQNTLAPETGLPAGYVRVRNADLRARRVGYEDLVGACDVVITKPGYGTVSECIANRTRMIYTSRGQFVEYPILVEGIERHLTSAFLSNADLRCGAWQSALDDVLSRPPKPLEIAIDGAAVAAEILSDLLD